MKKLVLLFLIILSTNFRCQSLGGTINDTLVKKIYLPQFILKLVNISNKNIYETKTDKEGKFDFGKIEKGKYKLNIIENEDYIKNEFDIDVNGDTKVQLIAKRFCTYRENKSSTCPICKTDKNVLPIFYGLVTTNFMKKNKKKYYFAGCEITYCNPKFYCKTDGVKF